MNQFIKSISLGITLLFVGGIIPPVQAAEPAVQSAPYVCPMHPHIHGQAGDTCPICGMKLVPAPQNQAAAAPMQGMDMSSMDTPPTDTPMDMKTMATPPAMSHTLTIDPVLIQRLGVRSAPVERATFGQEIRSYGQIVPSTRLQSVVSSRVGGWVKTLATDAVGDKVSAGQELFTLYSPELISAQKDYLTARKMGNPARVQATIDRLRLLGVDDGAFETLKKTGKVLEQVPFHSPRAGTVTTLNLRPGQYVEAGHTLLEVQDFSKVWVEADVAEKDLAYLATGQAATVQRPDDNARIAAVIDFIPPTLDTRTRTARVRLVLDNAAAALRPGQYVDVRFSGRVGAPQLAVPESAVIYDKSGAYVLVAEGMGRFTPRHVTLGAASGERVAVKTGLQAGEQVVVAGQFMLDAESHLRGPMPAMPGMDMKPKSGMDMQPEEGAQMKGMNHAQ